MRHCRGHNSGIKQYSTIEILCQYKDNDGNGLSLDDVIVKCDMHSSSGRHVDSLDITVTDSLNGMFLMTPTIKKLPADTLSLDILFERDGKIITSDTFTIDVDLAITEPPSEV